ncbi:sulfotransferase [Streptomyces angustmyceticus]|uniref:Putative sulfotransferase n=1 Tax=Streptomyces angustmyceticus TaxID=285578 RepID=A0A5J4LIX0_9ACTN|nr:sulfotransferase [Streptomyces angustmyceticus]UAL70884.1 sulfotransferase [Streptomyces angustmyceticus]GES33993.1 putative sulfotransferase [Streptomyces angustmyceticus]
MLTHVPLPRRQELTPRGILLAHPRLPWPLRAVNGLLGPLAPRLWPLEPDVLKRKAAARAKVPAAAPDNAFDEPLALLCRSLTEEVRLSANGRFMLHSQLVKNLSTRLRLAELAARSPEIFETPVPAPLFITGAPRTGTTFLQRLIARDRSSRSLPLWESTHPLPDGELTAARKDPDPRIKASRVEVGMTNRILPEQALMHELVHDEAEEDNLLLSLSHCSPMYEDIGLVPAYTRWYTTTDHTEGYRYFKRVLQFLQWSRPAGDRWVLKSPGHAEMLVPLFGAFEDATVVHTHRDPVTSVISFSNMVAYGARVYFDHPNPHLIGTFAADIIERSLRAALRDRAGHEHQVVDVFFRPLVEDPIREIRRVYEVAGRELDDVTEQAMREYATAEKHRSGRHRYAAEDFALDVGELRERFAFYYDRFDVPREKR